MAVPFRQLLRPAALAIALAAVVTGCSDPAAPSIEDTKFAASLDVDLTASTKTTSGLYYRDVTVGTGVTAVGGSQVTVAYSLYNTNGSRWDQGSSLQFTVVGATEQGTMIRGFNEGVTGMKVGGRRQLVIPPHLGYGNQWDRSGKIPPNSILVFDVQLIAVQ